MKNFAKEEKKQNEYRNKKANQAKIGKIRLESDYKISTTEKQEYDHENQTRFKNQLQS